MTDEQRQDLRAKCEAATPGPWDWETYVGCSKPLGLSDEHGHDVLLATTDEDNATHIEVSVADAEFIVAARNALPALLDERDELADELERAKLALRKAYQAIYSDPEGARDAIAAAYSAPPPQGQLCLYCERHHESLECPPQEKPK